MTHASLGSFALLSAATLVIAASPAAAQPDPAPACAVNIVRAPDDVRPVVEHWVHAEPRCNTSLEVRIVPTESGLYVLARDEHGRSHERVVPDANSAGVLIASWSADDVVGAPAPVPPAAPVAVAPVAPPPVAPAPPPQVAAAPITRPPEIAGPSERVALAGPPGAEAVDRPSLVDSLGSPRHWLTVAYLTKVRTTRLDSDPNRGQGVALGLDPWNYGPLSFGFDSAIDYRSGVDYQLRHVADASVAFHASVMLGTARVHLVPSVSAGWVYTYALQSDATYQTLSSIAEASLTAAIRLDRHAEATAGAISTYYGQRTPAPLIYRDWDLAVLGGVRWGW